MKRAFTLAEVMITLTVIGIITAIILPVAFHSKPDENIMKFKKAHNTLYQVVSELINSDKYYLNGDLGVKPDGGLVDSASYFCNTIKDVLTTKSSNCEEMKNANIEHSKSFVNDQNGYWGERDILVKDLFDFECKEYPEAGVKNMIVLTDNVVFYDCSPNTLFGQLWDSTNTPDEELYGKRMFTNCYNGFMNNYKIFCIDIDGANKGEDPFGYGIRADGKIITGTKADEWLNKSIQGDE